MIYTTHGRGPVTQQMLNPLLGTLHFALILQCHSGWILGFSSAIFLSSIFFYGLWMLFHFLGVRGKYDSLYEIGHFFLYCNI